MSGQLVPLVLLPRYTTYVGANTAGKEFVTIGMDVTSYSNAIVNCWRGMLIGTASPTFAMVFEESSDQVTWAACSGGASFDPGAETEVQKTVVLAKRWMRIKVTLTGTNPAATCYAVGFLEERLS